MSGVLAAQGLLGWRVSDCVLETVVLTACQDLQQVTVQALLLAVFTGRGLTDLPQRLHVERELPPLTTQQLLTPILPGPAAALESWFLLAQ